MNTYCQNIETEITDYVTGELTKETKQKIWTCKKNDEPFFMTYTRFMAVLYDLDSAATIKVLWKFLEYSEFNTGNVFIPAWRKEEILKTLDISGSTYEKALKCLKDKKIITGSRGAYVLDPNIHWKGDYKSREALMKSKLQITLSAIGDFEKEGN